MTSSKLLSPSLPSELVEEILHRIPIESLARFKSVSKQWYALFNDKIFIYKHLDLFEERLVLVNHKLIQLFNLETKALSSSKPTPDELHNYKILTKINHCDGLFLIKCSERGIDHVKLAVLNPVLSRIKWIELRNPSNVLYDAFGFGYDNVSRDNYKILRIGVTYDVIKGRLSSSSSYIEIYELKSKLWRSVDATLPSTPPWINVSMNGNMYWIAQKKKMVDNKVQLLIESFDFSTETFKTLCCVPKGIADCFSSDDHDTVLSCFRGDRLSLLHRQKHVTTEVWVTSKVTDDGIVSWSNYFNVSLPDPSPMLSSSFSRTTFIFETNKIILCCEDSDIKNKAIDTNFYEIGDEGKINKVDITEQREWVDAKSWIAYVPSLVPVPE